MLVLLSVVAWPDVWLRHDALSPTDLIYFYTPWAVHATEDTVPGTNPVLSDLVDMFYPQMEYMRKCLKEGDIPFWCDKIQNGTPFLLVIKHELMTLPLLALIMLLKVPVGLTVFFIFRHLIGGLFLYKYARIIGMDRWAGLCGAIAFSYCKYTIQDFILPMDFQLFLIPMVAYGTERIIRDRSLLWVWLIPVLHWMNILSGFPAGTAYCLYFLALYAAWRATFQPGRRLRLLGLFALLNVIPFLAAAPALVATADFFSGFDWSYRESYWSWRLPMTSLLTWFFPIIYGPPYARGTPIGWWYEYAFHIGTLPVLLVIQSLLFRRYDNVRVFFLLFTAWLIAILYNVGNILEHVVRHLPVFNSNPNTRQKLLLVFTLAILFAYALNDLPRVTARLRKLAAILAAPIGVVAAAFAARYALSAEATAFVRSAFWLQAAAVLASLGVFVVLGLGVRAGVWVKALAVLVLFVDLQLWDKSWYPLSFGDRNLTRGTGEAIAERRIAVGWNPTIRRETFYPKIPAMDFLIENIGPHKLLGLNTTCLANVPLFYGVNNFSGRGFFDARQKGLYRLVNEDAFTGGQNTAFFFESSLRTRLASPIVDALGIKYVALDHRMQIEDLQRDYAVKQTDWNAQIAIAPGQSLRQSFTPSRSIKLDRCMIQIAQGLWKSASPAELRLRDATDGREAACAHARWIPAMRRLEFDLDGFETIPGHEYVVTLTTKPDAGGPVDVLCTKDVDIIRSGSIDWDGGPWKGDLTFSLFADHGNTYAFDQKEWNDSAQLLAGESLTQTYRAARELTVDRFDVRVQENALSDPAGCRLTITDVESGEKREWTDAEWDSERGVLAFGLDRHALPPGREVELRLDIDGANAGHLAVYCTKEVDVLPEGTLSIGGRPRGGDLTASLYAVGRHDLSKYKLVFEREIVVLENTQVYGRAWLAGGLSYGSPEQVLSALSEATGDLRELIWAEEDMRAIAGAPRPAARVTGRVVPVELRSSKQVFSAEADRDCYLVVGDNYDHGWRAFIDGSETGVFRADYNLRAICLPKGSHKVEFVYRPPWLVPATALALFTMAGHLYLIRRMRRKARPLSEKAAAQ